MSIGAFYFYTEAMGLLQKWSDATEVIGCDGSDRMRRKCSDYYGSDRMLSAVNRIAKKKFDNFDTFRKFYSFYTYNYASRCWCGLPLITS